MTRDTRLRWRRIAGALPAVALMGAGTALAATGGDPGTGGAAGARPPITVPSYPLDHLEAPQLPPLPELPAPPEQTPTTDAEPAALPTSMSADGIPAIALAAYRRAVQVVDAADAQCRVDWPLVAAIGKVESDHGRYGGNGIDRDGTVRPGIFGIPLDGSDHTAVVHDSDGGTLDRDTIWDRAVGPMQFIPGTWRTVGVDANGDGRKDPQNFADAATAAAVYLCSGPGDLSTESGAHSAVLRYNDSETYANEVLAIARGYREGYTVDPASALTDQQRYGAAYLPSGQPQAMQQYDPATRATAGAAPAGRKPASGPDPSRSGSTSGSGGAAAGQGGSGSLTGAATSTVSGVVHGVTGGGAAAPTPAPTPAPSPTPTTTPVVVLPVIGPLGVPTCPSGYLLSLDGKSCTKT